MWSAVLNYGVLLAWFLVFWRAHEWLYQLHSRWFDLPRPEFDQVHYRAMALVKILILVLNLTPYLALSLVVG